jgi:multiple sugar transport system substrate-binding protein
MQQLKGIAWDHPRALAPLAEASARFEKDHDVAVTWDARSLAGFEETSISDLADGYDLIAIDHPFMGSAFEEQALVPVEDVLRQDFLEELAATSVGQSWPSYLWQGRHWAVPIDAAAQVSARRADLPSVGTDFVKSWADVVALAKESNGAVGVALNPTHMFLTTLTICHALAGTVETNDDLTPRWWTNRHGIQQDLLAEAIEVVRHLVPLVHARSLEWDPIQLLDRMSASDEISYVPAVFGYCSYARSTDVERPVAFGDVPGADGKRCGGVLGGVGLALSSRSVERNAAARFLQFVGGGAFQATGYSETGGQPAHRSAWASPEVNAWTPNFFEPTLPSLDAAFVRPRDAAYPEYQFQAGRALHAAVIAGHDPRQIAVELSRRWQQVRVHHR